MIFKLWLSISSRYYEGWNAIYNDCIVLWLYKIKVAWPHVPF